MRRDASNARALPKETLLHVYQQRGVRSATQPSAPKIKDAKTREKRSTLITTESTRPARARARSIDRDIWLLCALARVPPHRHTRGSCRCERTSTRFRNVLLLNARPLVCAKRACARVISVHCLCVCVCARARVDDHTHTHIVFEVWTQIAK